MGLDITVYKVIQLPEEKWNENTDSYIIGEDHKELSVFEDKSVKRIIEYYDLDNILKNMGYDPEFMFWNGTSYGDDVVFEYTDSKHDLHETIVFLDEHWSEVYFEKENELFESDVYKTYMEKYYPLLNGKYGYENDFKFYASGNETNYFNLNKVRDFVENLVRVKIINPTTVPKEEKCIAVEEVGYQRKGANKKFYSDGMWDSPCVLTLETLKEHHEKYFSYPTPDDKGGWGSGVEYDMEADEMKKYFQENIIDNFVEGETFVIYH